MTTRSAFRIGDIFGVIGSAIAVASASEAGRKPRARDLQRLGIDPDQFGRIGR